MASTERRRRFRASDRSDLVAEHVAGATTRKIGYTDIKLAQIVENEMRALHLGWHVQPGS